MLTVRINGLDQIRANLKQFSDRRFAAAMATAITRTAVKVKAVETTALQQSIDRPTPYTMQSLYLRGATAQRLSAEVWFKDDRATTKAGTPATKYLMPNVVGGGRGTKRLEVALQAAGALPRGWQVVPGQGARLDGYGNVSRGLVVQVLSQLRIQLVAGSNRNMSFKRGKEIAAQRKAGGRFFVMPPGKAVPPGVYQREFIGRNITPIFIFVRATSYRRRFDFYGVGDREMARALPVEVERAIAEHVAKLQARGAA